MEEIKEVFKEKDFGEEELRLIENFINEFDDLFGKYVPRDEVIRRIKQNLNRIEYPEDLGDAGGNFVRKDKTINIIKSLNRRRKTFTFFS